MEFSTFSIIVNTQTFGLWALQIFSLPGLNLCLHIEFYQEKLEIQKLKNREIKCLVNTQQQTIQPGFKFKCSNLKTEWISLFLSIIGSNRKALNKSYTFFYIFFPLKILFILFYVWLFGLHPRTYLIHAEDRRWYRIDLRTTMWVLGVKPGSSE